MMIWPEIDHILIAHDREAAEADRQARAQNIWNGSPASSTPGGVSQSLPVKRGKS